MQKLISIIIPIYKVEKYLCKCIDSVLQQTYKNIEIILVDDGSPDKCGEICDRYASNDDRIIVIHKDNGGLSDARNAGLRICSGEYITFVDSDDYIMTDYCKTLLDLLVHNKADMSCVSFYKYLENGKDVSRKQTEKIYSYTAAEAMSAMFKKNNLGWCAPAKLYNNELYKDIEYPVGQLMEDKATTYKIFNKCNKIVYKDVKKYVYFVRHGSITNSGLSPQKLDSFNVQLELNAFIEKKYPNTIIITHAYTVKVALLFLCGLSKEKYNDINKYRYFQKYVQKYAREFAICNIIDYRYKILFIMLNLLYFVFNDKAYTSQIYTKISRYVITKKQA